MASEKVSALTEASSLGQSDALYVVQSNVSKKIPVSKLGAAIKLTNIEIPGLGFTYDSSYDPSICIYDSNSNLDPILEINASSGLLIRGESSGSGSQYYQVSWDDFANVGRFFSQDSEAEVDVVIDNWSLEVKNKEHPQEKTLINSWGIELYNSSGQSLNFPFNILKELRGLAPGPSGKIASNGGYYINPSVKNPEGVVVELYQLDTQTSERTDTLIQGAKYRSDGIEYYNGNGSIGWVAAADIAALDGLGSYTGDLATLLQDLDDRITALENA